jgi:formylmethanofuran dehydrogenase subunit B
MDVNHAWIDPFCPLLSDRIGLVPGDPPQPAHPGALRTARALQHFGSARLTGLPAALRDGIPTTLDDALAAAAALIGSWRQPLFGGLGTDVAGARALTRLALRCGAIQDHAFGDSMTQALRALQDRGGYSCTLSEVRNRADLIVCIGVDPAGVAPDFFARCGVGESVPDSPPRREVVFLPLDGKALEGPGIDLLRDAAGVQLETLELQTDAHVVIAELNAACSGRKLARGSADWPALQALAARLQAARYAVLVHAPSKLPGDHAALLVEAIARIVKTLNRTTRAAALAIGGADGSATVSQTATWLTGLPLRTALHEQGFEHDPHRFSTRRLLENGAADGLLWVSSFSPELLPPIRRDRPTPLVVLGHPAMASIFQKVSSDAAAAPEHAPAVYIAVATPGVNAPGQLFRGDGGIVLPLKPFLETALPGVADVAQRLLSLLQPAR